jgi:glucose-6-phosphate 1-dehydrogenase
MQPVLDAWATEKGDIPSYASGTDDPAAADKLMEREGKCARLPVRRPPERKP